MHLDFPFSIIQIQCFSYSALAVQVLDIDYKEYVAAGVIIFCQLMFPNKGKFRRYPVLITQNVFFICNPVISKTTKHC